MYERLFARQGSDDVLHFDSIAEIAVCKDGTLNRPKLKALVRMFRPARDGELTMIDFLKSVDSVYKEFRVLQASIENAGTVDRAFELMVNWYVHGNFLFNFLNRILIFVSCYAGYFTSSFGLLFSISLAWTHSVCS